jgi:hypothetical protein
LQTIKAIATQTDYNRKQKKEEKTTKHERVKVEKSFQTTAERDHAARGSRVQLLFKKTSPPSLSRVFVVSSPLSSAFYYNLFG